MRQTAVETQMHLSNTAPVPASDPSRAGNALFYTVQGLLWRSDLEQSRVMAPGTLRHSTGWGNFLAAAETRISS